MQLKSLRRIYNVLFVFGLTLFLAVIAVFILFLISAIAMDTDLPDLNLLFVIILLLFSAILVDFVISLAIVVRFALRFDAIASYQLDADVASEALGEFMRLFGRRKSSIGLSAMKCQIMDLRGQYHEAVIELANRKVNNLTLRYKLSLVYFYLRCGMVENARTLYEQIKPFLSPTIFHSSAHTHTIGLYHLETVDAENARKYFAASAYLEETALVGKKKIAKMNCEYDLARLEEKEGNFNKAIDHYRQASAIGPKTWMGQEAARRVVALSHYEQ